MENEIKCAKCQKTFVASAEQGALITTCPTCGQIARLPPAKPQRVTAIQIVQALLFLVALTFCCAVIGFWGAAYLTHLLIPLGGGPLAGLGLIAAGFYGAVGCGAIGSVSSGIFIARTGMKATTKQYAKATGITFCLIVGGLLLAFVPALIGKGIEPQWLVNH